MIGKPTIRDHLGLKTMASRRWMAVILILFNGILLAISLLATANPLGWHDTDPFRLFPLLTAAIIFLQATPFARSFIIHKSTTQFGEIDEFERSVSQSVIGKAYRTTGLTMIMLLFALMLANYVADVRPSAEAAIYWLMWLAFIFFSLPTIFAAFAVREEIDGED